MPVRPITIAEELNFNASHAGERKENVMTNSIGGMNGLNASQMAEMRDKMISRIDKDGDEKISREEFSVFQANAPAGAKSVDEIFGEIDIDGDGSISKTENEDAMKKMAQEGKANRPPMGGPKGPPPGGGGPRGAGGTGGAASAAQTEETEESEDKNFNGIPDDEEESEYETKLTLESFLKEILNKYAQNIEAANAVAGKTKGNASPASGLGKDLYA